MSDSSGEACPARKDEAPAQRGFFGILKELRLIKVADAGIEEQSYRETWASFSPTTYPGVRPVAPGPVAAPPIPRNLFRTRHPGRIGGLLGAGDVPSSVGKPRRGDRIEFEGRKSARLDPGHARPPCRGLAGRSISTPARSDERLATRNRLISSRNFPR